MASHCVSQDKFTTHFTQLEQKVIGVRRSNSMLEVKLDEANRLIKFYSTKEKSLTEERDILLTTVTSLQQSLLEQNILRVEVRDSEAKKILEEKDGEVDEMRKKLKDQEREQQSKLLRLQLEFGAKLAKVQSSAKFRVQQQQRHHGSSVLTQIVFKRKLQFIQEEKNKKIMTLHERIKDLEENQRGSEAELKRKKN